MKSRQPDYRLPSIAKGKSLPSSGRSSLGTVMKTVSLFFPSSKACFNQSTVNINEDESGDSDVESQDEDDIGFGARTGGGFTSVVRIQNVADIALNPFLDNLKGFCTATPVGSPEEAVGYRE
jgi:hypothetical protein